MTLRAACIMALIAVGVIVTTPPSAMRVVIVDLPSEMDSSLFVLRGAQTSAEVYRVDRRGRITVNEQEWNRKGGK